MRYCKGRLKIGYFTHPAKMISQNKDYFLVIKKNLSTFAEQKINSLPGGIPGNDMKIKESEQLKMLATESGKTANQVSETIVTELINKQIIENISDNWGFPVADCYERDVTVVEMVDVIRAIGIYPVRSVHLDALLECVLIGDDDCPECGGEMEVTDGEYRRTGGDGYLTPPEYSPIWEEKTCRNCGYKESNEPSY